MVLPFPQLGNATPDQSKRKGKDMKGKVKDKIVQFLPVKRKMLTRVVVCLLIFNFVLANTLLYGEVGTLRQLRRVEADRSLLDERFPIFSHFGELIGTEERAIVHKNGTWHRGVQAYVIYETQDGRIQVLRQKRSQIVDIAKGKYDQSLATQIIAADGAEPENALKRGLRQELGIMEDEIEYTRVGREGWLRAIKKYDEDPSLKNFETISLYIVKVNRQDIEPVSPKVDSVEWVDWEEYASDLMAHVDEYTSTARFYVADPIMLRETNKAIEHFVGGVEVMPFPLRRVCFYSYPGRYNIFLHLDYVDNAIIYIYDLETKEVTEYSDVIGFQMEESEDGSRIGFNFTDHKGRNFTWRDGKIEDTGRRANTQSAMLIDGILRRFKSELAFMQGQSITPEERAHLDYLDMRLSHNLKLLRARAYAGDVIVSDSIRLSPNDPELLPGELAEEAVMIAMPGTFDPIHLDHIDMLLGALIDISGRYKGKTKRYTAFIASVGESAPGPDGKAAWKSDKTTAVQRHEMSKRLTDVFAPLIQTSMVSLAYPSRFGTDNAIELTRLNRDDHTSRPRHIDFWIACGSDTFVKWRDNFADIVRRQKETLGYADINIIVKAQSDSKVIKAMARDLPCEVVISHRQPPLKTRSTDLRQGLKHGLLPRPVSRFIKRHGLYPKLNRPPLPVGIDSDTQEARNSPDDMV